MFALQSVSMNEFACTEWRFVPRSGGATSHSSASFVPVAEAKLPCPSEVFRELISISNLIDLEDSWITLTGGNIEIEFAAHSEVFGRGVVSYRWSNVSVEPELAAARALPR
jgi:hypothetical protein